MNMRGNTMNQLNPEEYLEKRDRAFCLMRKANLYAWSLKNCEVELGYLQGKRRKSFQKDIRNYYKFVDKVNDMTDRDAPISKNDVIEAVFNIDMRYSGIIKQDTTLYDSFPEYGGKPIAGLKKNQMIVMNGIPIKDKQYFVRTDNSLGIIHLNDKYFVVESREHPLYKVGPLFNDLTSNDMVYKKGVVKAKDVSLVLSTGDV